MGSILFDKYRNFLQNRYPPCRKNTEILLKNGTHLAEEVQKISQKQPMYSLASRTTRHRKCPPPGLLVIVIPKCLCFLTFSNAVLLNTKGGIPTCSCLKDTFIALVLVALNLTSHWSAQDSIYFKSC